jgi:hypothetical protein
MSFFIAEAFIRLPTGSGLTGPGNRQSYGFGEICKAPGASAPAAFPWSGMPRAGAKEQTSIASPEVFVVKGTAHG